ncbi:TetR/AcrR family transcriptional regulator [Staphylococcus caeli]|uniref:TetR/AcrR family transcriptional regulator n=1 Tax=Staphylococcus caeli TaxID=2201815 RepID=UPI003F577323
MKQGRPQAYRREQVLASAQDAFWQRGYSNVSTQQLCDVTNLGKSSLYHSFKNKHTLFITTLEAYVDEGIRIQREKVLNNRSIKEGIDALLQWGIDNDFSDENIEGCYMINSYLERGNLDIEVANLMKRNMDAIKTLISTAVDRAKVHNELRESVYTLDELKDKFLMDYFGFRLLNAIDSETTETAIKRKNMIIKAIFK